MKRIAGILLLLGIPCLLLGDFVHWLGDYKTAHQKALQTNKPLLVLVVKKNSVNAGETIQTVFMNQSYVDTINEKMVAVMVTYEGVLSYPVEMYYTTVFPTLFFVDGRREIFLAEPLYGLAISDKAVKEKVEELLK